MQKGDLACDPRGLIFEAYRIEGIEEVACRTMFLDWALGVPPSEDPVAHIKTMLDHYGSDHPDHPMTAILKSDSDTITAPPSRKGRRSRSLS